MSEPFSPAKQAMRRLTSIEIAALAALVKKLPESLRWQVLEDLRACTVQEAQPEGTRLTIFIPGYDRPQYSGQHAVGGGGVLSDSDGESVDVTLFADENDRILKIELLKWAPAPLHSANWNTFRVACE